MGALFDTHALLWWLAGDGRLATEARDFIADPANTVHFSAVNIYEVLYKVRLGKLSVAPSLLRDLPARLTALGFTALPVAAAHAARAAVLEFDHRDPFDRLLVGQALEENLALLSNESLFDETAVRRVW